MRKKFNHDEAIITGMDIQPQWVLKPLFSKTTVQGKKKTMRGRKKKR